MKEFFHNEGIHSTTIQPEFVETGGGDPSNASITSADDCMLACPKVSERCQIGEVKNQDLQWFPRTKWVVQTPEILTRKQF